MIIVKIGDKAKSRRLVKEFTCSTCDSTFLYNKSDVKRTYGEWCRVGTETSVRDAAEVIVCPVCGEEIILNTWEDRY